jgi:hypothetical protein
LLHVLPRCVRIILGARVFGGAKRDWVWDGCDRFNSYSAEAVEGLRRFSELFLIEAHFAEGC